MSVELGSVWDMRIGFGGQVPCQGAEIDQGELI